MIKKQNIKNKKNLHISKFFDDMSQGRNEKIKNNLIVDYEQTIRSKVALNILSPKKGEKILDIGCGNGRDISYMIDNGAEVIGIDLSQGMINEAKRDLKEHGYDNITLEVGDATSLCYKNAEFDKVLCSEVIEHIPNAENALEEIYRILKPKGMLVITTPNWKSWYGFDRYVVWEKIFRKKWNHPYDNWRNMNELSGITQKQGFVIQETKGICYVPGFLISYFLIPNFVKKILLVLVSYVEPMLSKIIPEYGYMICIAAIKSEIK